MPPRRSPPTPTLPLQDDFTSGEHEVDDPSPSDDEGPVTACLACGSTRLTGDDCPHDDRARFDHLSPALHAALRRLQLAWQERRQHARSLRRLVTVEVGAGRGDFLAAPSVLPQAPPELPPPPPLPGTAAPAPPADDAPCPHCGRSPVAPSPRTPRRHAASALQQSFSFAAPDAPAPSPRKGTRRGRQGSPGPG